MNKEKIFTAVYLLLIAVITVTVYVFIPLSITSLIVTAAFIINVFLFVDVFKKK